MSLNLGSLGMEDASFNFGGSYIMALDCGTTSVLATIVDEYGCIVAQARAPAGWSKIPWRSLPARSRS